jgi:hypothetical protein
MTPTGSRSESPKQNFSESDSVIEKKFQSQIGVKVITTSDKVLRFYEPVTSFFISTKHKKRQHLINRLRMILRQKDLNEPSVTYNIRKINDMKR